MHTSSQERFFGLPFTTNQAGFLLLLGAILWFVAAMLLRALAPSGIYEGASQALLYALIIPGTIPFLLLSLKMARVERSSSFAAVALMTMSAMLLDGVALACLPFLYGGTVEYIAGAGATILWGAAVGLVLALFINRAR